jgi:anti-anti-sigma factor
MKMEMGLKVNAEEEGRNQILRLAGRIDAASSAILEKKMANLLNKEKKYIALDFSEIDYLSSAGMRLLLSMTKKIQPQGGGLVLFSVGEDVMEIIKVAGFDKVLKIFSNEEQALEELGRKSA